MYFYNRELDLLQPFRLLMVLLLLNPNMIYWVIYVVAFQAYRISPKDCHIYSVWQRHMMHIANLNNTVAA